MNQPQLLHRIIEVIAPIDGVSIGTWGDAQTVRIDFKNEATQTQRDAAQQALKTFDWNAPVDARSDRDKKLDAIITDYETNKPNIFANDITP